MDTMDVSFINYFKKIPSFQQIPIVSFSNSCKIAHRLVYPIITFTTMITLLKVTFRLSINSKKSHRFSKFPSFRLAIHPKLHIVSFIPSSRLSSTTEYILLKEEETLLMLYTYNINYNIDFWLMLYTTSTILYTISFFNASASL